VRVSDESGLAGWAYLRFRELDYDDAAQEAIAARLRALGGRDLDTVAYFRHGDEPSAPAAAEAVLGRL
jgi:hypothetical protein